MSCLESLRQYQQPFPDWVCKDQRIRKHVYKINTLSATSVFFSLKIDSELFVRRRQSMGIDTKLVVCAATLRETGSINVKK